MSYTASQPYDLGFLSEFVVGTGNTTRVSSGDSTITTPSDWDHYYSFAYAGGLSTVSITLFIPAAFGSSSDPNYHEIYLGTLKADAGLTPLSAVLTTATWGGNTSLLLGAGEQEGQILTATFQVANANPGRATFEVQTFGWKGTTFIPGTETDTPDVSIDVSYHVSVDIKSESPVFANNTTASGTKNGQLQLSNLLTSASGASYQQIQLWDSLGGSGGGFVVNGQQQAVGQEIDITQSQLASTSFHVGGVGGTDRLWTRVKQNDGSLTAWQNFSVISPVDHAPVITSAPNETAVRNQSFAAASLFSVYDQDSDPIAKYALWDSTGNGHFVVNGLTQGTSVEIDITAAQLAQTRYQSGSGTDHLWVRAFDGALWGAWQDFNVSAPIDLGPTVTASDYTATHGQNIAVTNLFSASDTDGDTVTGYQFWDSAGNANGGHFVVGGGVQAVGQAIDVTQAQLSSTTFQSGSGSDHLWVRASDGIVWSDWRSFNVNAPIDLGPTVKASDYTAIHGQNIAVTNLFSASDTDGDTVTAYQFWDSAGNASGGHFVVGGVAQGVGQAINVTSAQLSSTTFQSGSGSDHLWVRASDGIAWSDWASFNVNAPIDQAPNVSGYDTSMAVNTSTSVLNLFHISLTAGGSIQAVQLWDSNAAATSGHWTVGGVAEPAQQAINVDWPTYTSSVNFMAASAPGTVDRIWERVSDGMLWSDWRAINVTSHS